jgi:hypothetical protein
VDPVRLPDSRLELELGLCLGSGLHPCYVKLLCQSLHACDSDLTLTLIAIVALTCVCTLIGCQCLHARHAEARRRGRINRTDPILTLN